MSVLEGPHYETAVGTYGAPRSLWRTTRDSASSHTFMLAAESRMSLCPRGLGLCYLGLTDTVLADLEVPINEDPCGVTNGHATGDIGHGEGHRDMIRSKTRWTQ